MKKDKPKTFIDRQLNKYAREFSEKEILSWKRDDAMLMVPKKFVTPKMFFEEN